MPEYNQERKTIILKPFNELRVEVDFGKKYFVKLKTGFAELFGAELGKQNEYEFSGNKFAIFSYEGCELEISHCSSEYTASTTPMNSYMNLHLALQNRRNLAKKNNQIGPRLLVLGSSDSGKSTLCRILANYAIRSFEAPIVINLDPANGMVTVPGTISATKFSHTINPIDGFMSHGVVNSSGLIDQPLVFYYGYNSVSEYPALFKSVVNNLAKILFKQLELNPKEKESGFIIDTFGNINPSDYHIVDNIISSLQVDTILVVGNEKLYNDFTKKYQDNSLISIASVQKSGGVVNCDLRFLKNIQNDIIKKYFHGCDSEKLQSFSTALRISETGLFKIGQDSLAPSSTLPLGETRKVSETQISQVTIDERVQHMIIGVSQLDLPEATKSEKNAAIKQEPDLNELPLLEYNVQEESVLASPILGFLNV
ncbi:hypothetical protein BB561_004299 [Smittium simulii]|uniref:Polynucleotide 5'-hydroxyl-kinase GRC3 n=1 Tax=Smittium simulii TaxID=133385 RepID=A0A2T9YGZ1_9FUNG|nr:hypothetical protein BB561_004299 [Smittium simulii]